jgi:hypothetical protein
MKKPSIKELTLNGTDVASLEKWFSELSDWIKEREEKCLSQSVQSQSSGSSEQASLQDTSSEPVHDKSSEFRNFHPGPDTKQ